MQFAEFVLQSAGQSRLGEQCLHLAVVQYVGAPRRRRLGVDRHVCGTNLEDAEDRCERVDALVQTQPDAIARPDTEMPEPVAETVGKRRKLQITEAGSASWGSDRGVFRKRTGRLVEQARETRDRDS